MEKEILDNYIKAGKMLQEVLAHGKKMIKVGASVLEICDACEKKILELGGQIAFPAQISKNEVAAHFCPAKDDLKCNEGDIIKLDCGVHVNGFIADSAITVNLGDHDNLVKASQDALASAMKTIGLGVKVSEVGKAIQEAIESYGFSPVRNLSGHGLGKYTVHTSPSVPNYDTGSDLIFEKDMVVAVEPFASNGAGIIYASGNPTLYSFINDYKIRNVMARKLLKDIKAFNGLPFTTRWLTKKHPEGMVRIALNELARAEVLETHPPLIDKEKGFVSQAEHTVIIQDKPIIITKS